MRILAALLSIGLFGFIASAEQQQREDVAVGIDGSALDQQQQRPDQHLPPPPSQRRRRAAPPIPPGSAVEVSLENHYDEPVKVNFVRHNDEEILIMELEMHGNGNVNTYVGHNFAVRSAASGELLEKIKIGQDETIFMGAARRKASTPAVASTAAPPARPQHPLVEFMHAPRSRSVGGKFKSLSTRALDIWWDDGRSGLTQGVLNPGAETTTNAYEDHVFYFTEKGNKANEVARVVITANRSTYLIRDKPEFTIRSDLLKVALDEEAYQQEYLKRTGVQYRHYYGPNGPRAPPSLHMWPATEVGQVHRVNSSHGYWKCEGSKSQCQSSTPLNLQLEVVYTHPKIFVIENFLSDAEADHIISVAKPRVYKSTVGNSDSGVRKSETRTSSNTWVSRSISDIANTLYLRAADVLKVDESLLQTNRNAEDMQVVHYAVGEKYDAHHDWGVAGSPESRYITLLLYLSTMPDRDSGGETAFPKADNGHGIKVHPRKGTAVLFYSLLEDGNGDDLSLHQAIPVRKGEKWLANFWVWDPKKRY